MRRIRLNFSHWGPSYLRGWIAVNIAVLTALVASLAGMTDQQFEHMSRRSAWMFWGALLLAAYHALRTYLDSSHAAQKMKVEQQNEHPSYTAISGTNQPVP